MRLQPLFTWSQSPSRSFNSPLATDDDVCGERYEARYIMG